MNFSSTQHRGIDVPFADMASDIDFDTNAPATQVTEDMAAQRFVKAEQPASIYKEQCSKCGGRGKVTFGYVYRQVGTCFACKGRGFHEFKTSPETRAKARSAAESRREGERLRRLESDRLWREEHKDVCAWIAAKDGLFDFATAMSNALVEYGKLTEGQIAAVRRCIDKDGQRAAERAAAAPTVEVSALVEAFALAAKTLKYPRLRFDGFKVTPASATGRNAGALYVKDDSDEYLGKVQDGKFFASRACTPEVQAQVLNLIADPAAAAKQYGLETGRCCVCAKELTDKGSIEAGIGPICARKFGF